MGLFNLYSTLNFRLNAYTVELDGVHVECRARTVFTSSTAYPFPNKTYLISVPIPVLLTHCSSYWEHHMHHCPMPAKRKFSLLSNPCKLSSTPAFAF